VKKEGGYVCRRCDWLIAVVALVMTFLLLKSKRFPAMFALLLFGITVAFIKTSALAGQLMQLDVGLRLPEVSPFRFTWNELVMGYPDHTGGCREAAFFLSSKNRS